MVGDLTWFIALSKQMAPLFSVVPSLKGARRVQSVLWGQRVLLVPLVQREQRVQSVLLAQMVRSGLRVRKVLKVILASMVLTVPKALLESPTRGSSCSPDGTPTRTS
jgi:hypothetical protein